MPADQGGRGRVHELEAQRARGRGRGGARAGTGGSRAAGRAAAPVFQGQHDLTGGEKERAPGGVRQEANGGIRLARVRLKGEG
jgi:hypothetical protein